MNQLTDALIKSTNFPNLVNLQRLCKKAILEAVVARFPAGNSFTLTLTASRLLGFGGDSD